MPQWVIEHCKKYRKKKLKQRKPRWNDTNAVWNACWYFYLCSTIFMLVSFLFTVSFSPQFLHFIGGFDVCVCLCVHAITYGNGLGFFFHFCAAVAVVVVLHFDCYLLQCCFYFFLLLFSLLCVGRTKIALDFYDFEYDQHDMWCMLNISA